MPTKGKKLDDYKNNLKLQQALKRFELEYQPRKNPLCFFAKRSGGEFQTAFKNNIICIHQSALDKNVKQVCSNQFIV